MRRLLLPALLAAMTLTATPAFAWTGSAYTGQCVLIPLGSAAQGQGSLGLLAGGFTTFLPTMTTTVVSASVSCSLRVNGVVVDVLSGGTMSGPTLQSGSKVVAYAASPGDVVDVCWTVDYTDPSDTSPTASTC